jgi:hypothetical protein
VTVADMTLIKLELLTLLDEMNMKVVRLLSQYNRHISSVTSVSAVKSTLLIHVLLISSSYLPIHENSNLLKY